MIEAVRIGTRKSALAVAQAELAADLMREAVPGLKTELVLKQTTGDRILDKPLLEFGGKGVFVSEFEEALQRGELDFAVHSAKDLPMELAEGLEIVGVPAREDFRDVLVTRRDGTLEEKIRRGEDLVIGTSSLRRKLQIEELGPKLWPGARVRCENLRGNVQTRLGKLREGGYDAIILAAAGLKRLGLMDGTETSAPETSDGIGEMEGLGLSCLEWDVMIPAGCQGILAVEGRKGNPANQAAEAVCHREAMICFWLERRVLRLLEAGCHEPVGVCSRIRDGRLEARGIYQNSQGTVLRAYWAGAPEDWEQAAAAVAGQLKGQGGGSVTLVGAGPGDPGLITVKGLRALKRCDAVVYDSLASGELLKEVSKDCQRIYVGKRAGRHSMKQEEINRLLVKLALEGKRVVRLKGGDPFVFGRGGEEVLELEKAGIPFQVVPGVTSAVAALSSAGIPITHRGMSRSFHVITGHTRENGLPEEVEQAGSLDGTLVFLMGLHHLGEIRDSLLRQGKSPQTPAAVIQSGTLPDQKVVRGALADIEERCRKEQIGSPAIIAVGEVTALQMEGNLREPLSGVTVGVTGTPSFAGRLEAALAEQGALTERIPTVEVVSFAGTETVGACLADLSSYTWLAFTSANGVRIFLDALMDSGRDLRVLSGLKLAAVGSGTAKELERRGLRADYVPERYCTEALAEGLAERLGPSDRVLLPRAVQGSRDLTEILEKRGIAFTDLPLYDVERVRLSGAEWADCLDRLDCLTFASSSGVAAFFANLAEAGAVLPEGIAVAAIGEATAAALEKAGRPADLVADEFSVPGLVRAVCDRFC